MPQLTAPASALHRRRSATAIAIAASATLLATGAVAQTRTATQPAATQPATTQPATVSTASTRPAPLQVGDRAPDFTLLDTVGTSHTLSAHHASRALILVFFRGAW